MILFGRSASKANGKTPRAIVFLLPKGSKYEGGEKENRAVNSRESERPETGRRVGRPGWRPGARPSLKYRWNRRRLEPAVGIEPTTC
jgi:hypothetical protein